MRITLETTNYRTLRRVHWSPSGVCVVVGANGAGKTTLLTLFEFLRNAFQRRASDALAALGGVWGLRSWGTSEEDPVRVALTAENLRWELQLLTRGPTLADELGEKVTQGSDVLLSRAPLSKHVTYNGEEIQCGERLGLSTVIDARRPLELAKLVHLLVGLRVYRGYNLGGLRTHGSQQTGDNYLHPSGENVFSVLRNWRDRSDLHPRYEFVLESLKRAFPDLFVNLDFQQAGLTVTAELIDAWNNHCPVALAPNGWLTGLLHLSAIAGAQGNSLVAIDEFENSLHPYAIRHLIEAIRDWAEAHDLTVCLASHSPVVIDEFKDYPESVFVMERGMENLPVPLTELYDTDWLARFSLGRLYEHGEFGRQQYQTPHAAGADA
jgi:predicted ATPase